MIIYKLQQEKTNKVYIGYSVNDNPNNFGSGKYIKRAVKDFGTTSFKREVVEVFKKDQSLSDVLKRVEYWINKFKSDNSKYGFNEALTLSLSKNQWKTELSLSLFQDMLDS